MGWIEILSSEKNHSSYLFDLRELSRTPCLSLVGAMSGNNVLNEESSQSLPADYHGVFRNSLVDLQVASQNPFSRQIIISWLLASCSLQNATSHNIPMLHGFTNDQLMISNSRDA